MTAAPRESGFTLLEMLVTLVVLGLLLAGLASATHFALSAYGRQSAVLADAGRRAAVSRALRRLIAQAEPGAPAGVPHALRLVTRLPLAATTGDPTIDATIRLDRSHDLILAWRPHPWGQPLAPLPRPNVRILLHGVSALDVAYWWQKPNTDHPAWYPTSPSGTVPRLIRLTLRFTDRNRIWPALIAAPMTSR